MQNGDFLILKHDAAAAAATASEVNRIIDGLVFLTRMESVQLSLIGL